MSNDTSDRILISAASVMLGFVVGHWWTLREVEASFEQGRAAGRAQGYSDGIDKASKTFQKVHLN